MKTRPFHGVMGDLLSLIGLGRLAEPSVLVNKPGQLPRKNPARTGHIVGRRSSGRHQVSVRDLIRRARTGLELQMAVTKGALYTRATDKTRRRWREAIDAKRLELNQGAAA